MKNVSTPTKGVETNTRAQKAIRTASATSPVKVERTAPRPERRDMFVQVQFRVFDLGLAAVVSPRLLTTYFALLRHVWRATKTGWLEVRELVRSGKLVAPISQTKLGAIVGLRRQGVSEQLRELTSLNWIKPISFGPGRSQGYELGYRDPRRGQVYFLNEWLGALAERTAMTGEGKLSRHERAEAARDLIEETKGVRSSVHVRSNRQEVSGPAHKPVYGGGDTNKREGEEAKKGGAYIEGEHTSWRWRAVPVWNEAHCREVLQRARTKRVSRWPLIAMAGLFAELYEERFKRSFPDGPRGWLDLQRGIERIAESDGRRWTKESIEAVFAEKWIHDPLGLIANEAAYDRCVWGLVFTRREKHDLAKREAWEDTKAARRQRMDREARAAS